MSSERSNQHRSAGEKGIGPSNARPGQENVEHFTANVSWVSPQSEAILLKAQFHHISFRHALHGWSTVCDLGTIKAGGWVHPGQPEQW